MAGNLGANFYQKLVEACNELGMKPEDLINIMISESGLNPAARNPGGGASGLVQFMPSVLKGVGFNGTNDDLIKLTGEEQIPYIKNLIKGNMRLLGGPFKSAAQYYVSNLWPAALKMPGVRSEDPKTVILEENPEVIEVNGKKYSKKYYDLGFKISPVFESKAYKQNPIFHGSTPGAITFEDFIKQTNKNKAKKEYQMAMKELAKVTGSTPIVNEKIEIPQTNKAKEMINDKNNKTDNYDLLVGKKNQQPEKPNKSFDSLVEKYVKDIFSMDKKLKSEYKKYLNSNDILIKVNSDNFIDKIEFCRILTSALEEDLSAEASTHIQGEGVEINCKIAGDTNLCFNIVKEYSQSISEAFEEATQKVGSIKVNTNCIMNKKSSYEEITYKQASLNYNKFLLKFV